MSRTFKGLLLEMNLEHNYEVKKACEDQLLNMHDDLKSQLTAAQDEITLLKAKLEKAFECIEWSKKWLQPVTLERQLRTFTPEEHVNYLLEKLNSITLETIKKG